MAEEWVVVSDDVARVSVEDENVEDMMQPRYRENALNFIEFIKSSPTSFHAVATCKKKLLDAGFTDLSDVVSWNLQPGNKYFLCQNNSAIVAFAVGKQFVHDAKSGFKIVGVHTDSPCLKVRPISTQESQGFIQVSVQLYGGGIWHSWFDRDLTVAGRVIVEENGQSVEKLVHIPRPLLRVPNLAIHLQTADEIAAFKFSNEVHLQPVLATQLTSQIKSKLEAPTTRKSSAQSRHSPVLISLLAKAVGCKEEEIEDFDLSLVDTQPPCLLGAFEEFISSPRMDNLLSTYCAMEALIASCNGAGNGLEDETDIRIAAAFDNEEVGSESIQGAASALLPSILQRIYSTLAADSKTAVDAYAAAVRRSFMISADMAHGVHPNYAEKHQEHFRPQLQKGVVLKHNANQRYATDSIGASLIRELAAKNDIPIQEFTVKNDSPCGSTIGPLLSARTGVKTVDMGMPQLSMHSIREMCGVDDVTHQINLFKVFYSQFRDIPETLTHV
eukprot:GILJ01000530.1.p1 GENE.GILJ01000530.1~~GILJ01000530.1.p1  ORF type:complete len:517 (-),score=118.11 GILJ01000530.1:89-1588(-)